MEQERKHRNKPCTYGQLIYDKADRRKSLFSIYDKADRRKSLFSKWC